MSFNFQVDHDKANEGGIIPEGKYEVIVAKAFEDAAKSGTMFINLHLVVRNDIVGQPQQNRYIFGSIWQSKETGQYNAGMLNAVAKALKIENGKKYSSLDELLNDFIGKTCKVTVKHEEYNGSTNARIKGWEQSNYTTCSHVFKENQNTSTGISGFYPVDDDDIPF